MICSGPQPVATTKERSPLPGPSPSPEPYPSPACVGEAKPAGDVVRGVETVGAKMDTTEDAAEGKDRNASGTVLDWTALGFESNSGAVLPS